LSAGYDEGGFSASVGLQSFVKDYNLSKSAWKDDPQGLANRKANISSFGVLGAAFGAMIALTLADPLGRLRCWRIFVVTWASGLLLQVFSSGIYGLILFARICSGLGAGGLTVVAPLYLSEIARARSRGMVVSIYMVCLLSLLMIGEYLRELRLSVALT
jgi:MFS family permease